jgi:hypothetical protein
MSDETKHEQPDTEPNPPEDDSSVNTDANESKGSEKVESGARAQVTDPPKKRTTILPWFLFAISTVIAVAALAGLIYIWSSYSGALFDAKEQVNSITSEMQTLQTEKEAEIKIVMERMGLIVGKMVAAVWRDVLHDEDIQWIQNILPWLVKNTDTLYIHVLNANHRVIATTDQKYIDTGLPEGIEEARAKNDALLRSLEERRGKELVIPIMFVNQYIGTIKIGFDYTDWVPQSSVKDASLDDPSTSTE